MKKLKTQMKGKEMTVSIPLWFDSNTRLKTISLISTRWSQFHYGSIQKLALGLFKNLNRKGKQMLNDSIKCLKDTILKLKIDLKDYNNKLISKRRELEVIQEDMNKINETILQHESAIQIIERNNNE